jgi:hypothetical protein
VRSIVDGALVSGMSPHQIAEQYGDRLGVSRSAVYRYARSRRGPLAPQWITETTTVTEAASDLDDVRRDLKRRYDAAGPNTDAARVARELTNLTAVLKSRFDVDADGDVEGRATNDEAVALFITVLHDTAGLLDSVRGSYDVSPALAAELDSLAVRFADEN